MSESLRKLDASLPANAVKPSESGSRVRWCWHCKEGAVHLADDPKKGLVWQCDKCGRTTPAAGGNRVSIKRAQVGKIDLTDPGAKVAELDELFRLAKSYFKGSPGDGAGKSFPMAQQKWAETALKALELRIKLEGKVESGPVNMARLAKMPAEKRKQAQALLDELQSLIGDESGVAGVTR